MDASREQHLAQVRSAYDTVAEDYARLLDGLLAASTWDRAVLGAFAERVRGPVLDAGCGPGRITAHLHGLGLDVSGVDLSPGMVAVARRDHPGLRFEVGELGGLDVADGALGGVVAWYSVIHTPPAELPRVLAELARVLAPGGLLLLAFHVGDELRHLTRAYGHDLSLDAQRLQPDRVAALLDGAGLAVQARLVREPEPPETVPQAYLLAGRA